MRTIEVLEQYPPIHTIFEVFQNEEDAVFLDSSLQNELGQHSIIGLCPYLKLVNGERFTVNGVDCQSTFEEYMKRYLIENKEKNETGLPLVSGAIGYYTYDYGRTLEGVASQHDKISEIPDSIFCFYDVFIIEDHKEQKLYLAANGHTQDSSGKLKWLKDRIISMKSSGTDVSDNPEVTPAFLKQEYLHAIEKMIRYIEAGDIYIANMTQQLSIESQKEPYEVFRKLRKINPSPFGGYLNYGDFQVVSASPERFLKMRNQHIVTRPIKGTRKRGQDKEEDRRLRQELINSEKDKSELLMITDLERNDLNKVCIPGSVKVTELFEIEEYATVFHLVSTIEGELQEGLTAADLIGAAFPGGSVTGAPKMRAMEIIDELEKERRGLYTGSMGYFSLNGDCDFNIVIRTAVYRDDKYHLGVGGGITCESDPESEYEEVFQKAQAVLKALE